ncbi:MAG TPA: hypothetical protein V6D12_03875 [Candidatus Obscuribacterales bacterium]
MTKTEILQALKQLNNAERLTIANAALLMAREEWKSLTPAQKEQQLAMSAQLAILDYLQDEELTAFTALDSEDFYDYTYGDFANLDSHA